METCTSGGGAFVRGVRRTRVLVRSSARGGAEGRASRIRCRSTSSGFGGMTIAAGPMRRGSWCVGDAVAWLRLADPASRVRPLTPIVATWAAIGADREAANTVAAKVWKGILIARRVILRGRGFAPFTESARPRLGTFSRTPPGDKWRGVPSNRRARRSLAPRPRSLAPPRLRRAPSLLARPH